MSVPCVVCQCNSISGYCFRHKPRKPMQAKKPMKKAGHTTKEWLAVRSGWLKQNKPNHRGNYVCYICKKEVWYAEITLDHIKSRSRYPELRYELTNLAPCCYDCNRKKGSRDLEEI